LIQTFVTPSELVTAAIKESCRLVATESGSSIIWRYAVGNLTFIN